MITWIRHGAIISSDWAFILDWRLMTWRERYDRSAFEMFLLRKRTAGWKQVEGRKRRRRLVWSRRRPWSWLEITLQFLTGLASIQPRKLYKKNCFVATVTNPLIFFFVYRLMNIYLDYSSLMRYFEAFSTMQICEPRRVLYRRQPRKFWTIWRVANFWNYRKHYHRWQIPLEPAFASTTHKMQGTGAKFGAVIDPSEKKTFARG